MTNDDPVDPDFAEHVRAVSLRRDGLVGEAEALDAETWRRLEAAGIPRDAVDAIARAMGSPPRQIPFAEILAALADRLDAQAETARGLVDQWQGWDAGVLVLEMEGNARAVSLEMGPARL